MALQRTRRGGTYAPFIPANIAERSFPFARETAAAVEEAEDALRQLRGVTPRLTSLDALARSVLLTESVASSRIEGVRVPHEGLGRVARTARRRRADDHRAIEVLGNLEAVEKAIEIGGRGSPFAIEEIEAIHRTLLESTEDGDIAGVIRREQDMIGGDAYNPVGADYVPPPPQQVREALEDLCAFMGRDDLPPTAQAAIAHAQFKNIHPFAGGNGRTGRALIFTMLRRRGATGSLVPPLSPVLASRPKAYGGGVGAYSVGDVGAWCEGFANATTVAAGEARWLADAVEAREGEWLERLGNPRGDSAVRQLLRKLPAHPVIDAGMAEALTGKSHTAVHRALNGLEEAGILQPLDERRWGRAWEAGELLELLTDFEARVSAARD